MAAVPYPRSASLRARVTSGLARKAAELVTVFAGVYAAFLLNDYQTHREEHQRREQILSWLEKHYSEVHAEIDEQAASIRKSGEKFNHQVEAGAMPALRAFFWNTTYSTQDLTGLLQSGGYTLLEVETVRSLQEMDDTVREIVTLALHDQQLSDALILPNLDKDPAVFYDPATKRLRPAYEWYGQFPGEALTRYARLHSEAERILQQLRVERARNR